jgi:hypothetical protein
MTCLLASGKTKKAKPNLCEILFLNLGFSANLPKISPWDDQRAAG